MSHNRLPLDYIKPDFYYKSVDGSCKANPDAVFWGTQPLPVPSNIEEILQNAPDEDDLGYEWYIQGQLLLEENNSDPYWDIISGLDNDFDDSDEDADDDYYDNVEFHLTLEYRTGKISHHEWLSQMHELHEQKHYADFQWSDDEDEGQE